MAKGRSNRLKDSEKVIQFAEDFVRQSDQAKQHRNELNRQNYETYHGRQDMSHKVKGQSTEFIPRQSLGTEHVAQFLHQGLMDFGDFFSVNVVPGLKEKDDTIFTSNQIRELIKLQWKHAGAYNHILDSLKAGILGSLMISKVSGKMVPKRKFKFKGGKLLKQKDKVWQLEFSLPRQRNMHLDPDNKNLCKIEEIELDVWELEALVDAHPKMFNKEKVKEAIEKAGHSAETDERDKFAETNQSNTGKHYRKTVRLWEIWGNILNTETGKLLYEHKTALVADCRFLISNPQDFPSWDSDDPYVIAPLIRSPNSVWPKALADFGTQLNKALNEVINLLIDSGIQGAFGLKQIREDWLEDPAELEDGAYPGLTYGVNNKCPPGQTAIQRVDTGAGSGFNEAQSAFNIISGELGNSMMLPDTRQGSLPARATKATEIVATENASNNVFAGIARSVETAHIEPLLEKSLVQILQNFKKMDRDELIGILGEREFKRINKFSEKELFAKSYGSFNFKVFGLTQTINKIKDFRKLTGLLQTIASNPELMEAFVREYSFTKLLGELVKALDINVDRIKHDAVDSELNKLEGAGNSAGINPLNQFNTDVTQQAQAAAGGNFETEAGGGALFSEVGSFSQ